MKIIIAGGGTGGHVFPAISIAEEILNRDKNNKILFVGTEKGIEKKVVPDLGYEIKFINSGGLIGRNFFQKLKGIISAFNGILSSFRILMKFKPDVVLGVGGYASGPTVLSAYLSNIPTAICEQNSVPGFTNKTLSKFVKKIFITYPESKKYFPEHKIVATGNPIRKNISKELTNLRNSSSDDSFTILILGGSQGAKALNETVPKAINILNKENIKIIHQTGEKNYHEVVKSYEELKINADVYKFIDNISEVYKKTDLIICRSGASTISEITVIGIPAILIPFPYATHNHQLHNAKILEENNAAILIEEKELNMDILAMHLDKLLKKEVLNQYSENSKSLGRPKAASEIANEIEILAGKK